MNRFWLAAGAALLVAVPALAHHSFAMFDQRKIMTLDGTVTEFQWTNPHAFIEMDVVTGGATQHWSIELNSPMLFGPSQGSLKLYWPYRSLWPK